MSTSEGLGAIARCLLILGVGLGLCGPGHAQTPKTITLVGENDWFPYSGTVDGRLQGMAVDVITAAYREVGVEVRFKTTNYIRCLKQVEDGDDLGCFDSLKDPALAQRFLFHKEPLFVAEIGIFALRDGNPQPAVGPESLPGRSVGLTRGYTYGDFVEKRHDITRDIASSDWLNLKKLVAKRYDFSLVYSRVAGYLIRAKRAELRAVPVQIGTLTTDPLYVSFSLKRGSEAQEAADLLDEGLRRIRDNGVYAGIEADWTERYPY